MDTYQAMPCHTIQYHNSTLHRITLLCITLHSITLHCITLHTHMYVYIYIQWYISSMVPLNGFTIGKVIGTHWQAGPLRLPPLVTSPRTMTYLGCSVAAARLTARWHRIFGFECLECNYFEMKTHLPLIPPQWGMRHCRRIFLLISNSHLPWESHVKDGQGAKSIGLFREGLDFWLITAKSWLFSMLSN